MPPPPAPAPPAPPVALPPLMVRFSNVALPPSTKNKRLVPPPLMVRPDAPEPSMVTVPVVLSAGNGPLVMAIVCPAKLPAKAMVLLPPAVLASLIAWRSDPAPLSLLLVTVKVAACAAPVEASFGGHSRHEPERGYKKFAAIQRRAQATKGLTQLRPPTASACASRVCARRLSQPIATPQQDKKCRSGLVRGAICANRDSARVWQMRNDNAAVMICKLSGWSNAPAKPLAAAPDAQ